METSKNLTFLRIANIIAYVMTVIVNSMSEILPLNGITTAEISDSYPTLIAPAGYVFSIWGVIYVLLGAFVIYQTLPSQKGKAFLNQIGYLFILGSTANITWIFLWHFLQIELSLVAMFILLGTLIATYLKLGIGKSDVPFKEKFLVHLPFSTYLGWITVAPIANVAATLVKNNWERLGL